MVDNKNLQGISQDLTAQIEKTIATLQACKARIESERVNMPVIISIPLDLAVICTGLQAAIARLSRYKDNIQKER